LFHSPFLSQDRSFELFLAPQQAHLFSSSRFMSPLFFSYFGWLVRCSHYRPPLLAPVFLFLQEGCRSGRSTCPDEALGFSSLLGLVPRFSFRYLPAFLSSPHPSLEFTLLLFVGCLPFSCRFPDFNSPLCCDGLSRRLSISTFSFAAS